MPPRFRRSQADRCRPCRITTCRQSVDNLSDLLGAHTVGAAVARFALAAKEATSVSRSWASVGSSTRHPTATERQSGPSAEPELDGAAYVGRISLVDVARQMGQPSRQLGHVWSEWDGQSSGGQYPSWSTVAWVAEARAMRRLSSMTATGVGTISRRPGAASGPPPSPTTAAPPRGPTPTTWAMCAAVPPE